jgi:hypothetical protein
MRKTKQQPENKMKKIMNLIGSEYDGEYMSEREGREVIMATARVEGWTANILALELDSWTNRF